MTIRQEDTATVDGLIAATRARNKPLAEELGARLVASWVGIQEAEEDGILLPFDDELLESDEAEDSDQRTEREVALARAAAVQEFFEDNPEPYHVWEVVQVVGTDGTAVYVAHLLQGNYPCKSSFVGAFDSVAGAVEAIRAQGYVTFEDYQCRYPAVPGPIPTVVSLESLEADAAAINAHGYVEDFQHLRICGTCYSLYETGRPVGREQRCRCRPGSEERWPGFDFNERALLCVCCGLEVLKSGSRWSALFCHECRLLAMGVSLWHRRLVFPIGRHSLMHTWVPDTQPPTMEAHGGRSGDLAETVQSASMAVSGGLDVLFQWSPIITSRNLERLALPGDCSLSEYLRAIARNGSGMTRTEAFGDLCEFSKTANRRPDGTKGLTRTKQRPKRKRPSR